MKPYVFILLALLIIPLTGAQVDVEHVMLNGEPIILESATLYIQAPQTIPQRDFFQITTVIQHEDFLNATLNLETSLGESLPFTPDSYDLDPSNETVAVISWQDSLVQSENYTFSFFVEDDLLYTKQIVVNTTPKQEVSTTIVSQETTNIVISANESLQKKLNEKGYGISQEELEELEQTANESIYLEKTITITNTTYADATSALTSRIQLLIQPTQNMSFVDIIETIPKSVAAHVSLIGFSQEPIVLEEDPMIMWHLEDVDEETILSYDVEGEAKLTGNTVLLAKTTAQTQGQKINWGILGPLLLIPLIALIIIYFSRFQIKK